MLKKNISNIIYVSLFLTTCVFLLITTYHLGYVNGADKYRQDYMVMANTVQECLDGYSECNLERIECMDENINYIIDEYLNKYNVSLGE